MRKSLLNETLRKEVIVKKKEGRKMLSLAKDYGVSLKTIQKITKGVKANGIEKNMKKLNVEEVLEKYKELGTLGATALFYLKSEGSIKELFQKNNILWDKINTSRKYDFNLSFFQNIDTEEKAYWLGFIFADGSMHKDGNGMSIGLARVDKSHLEKLANIINFDGPILDIESNESSYLALYSKEMFECLFNKGCFINKTDILRFPNKDIISDDLMSHFIRGYFDGDGCITSKPIFSISGNKEFLTELQIYLVNKLNLNFTKLYNHKKSKTYSMLYGGILQCKKIRAYLYTNASQFLTRKKTKFYGL